MHARSSKRPQRIPPPAEPSAARREPSRPAFPAEALTVTTDALALQAQLDRLAAHFEQLHAQLRQAQKLAGLGATAAMIAHEFNNLFTPVVAYAQHALDTDDVELMRKALTRTLEQARVMRHMSDRVVGLAKQGDGRIQAVRLREAVVAAVECLGRDPEKDNISVNIQIDPDLEVRANENQLLQVLFNLVINARQAMLGRRGRLTVDAVATGDGKVQINVRDTGCGIRPEHLPRIFEPFFSTRQGGDRPETRGLGLGLAISRDLVEEMGGSIDVTSEVGVGSTFTVTLPQAE